MVSGARGRPGADPELRCLQSNPPGRAEACFLLPLTGFLLPTPLHAPLHSCPSNPTLPPCTRLRCLLPSPWGVKAPSQSLPPLPPSLSAGASTAGGPLPGGGKAPPPGPNLPLPPFLLPGTHPTKSLCTTVPPLPLSLPFCRRFRSWRPSPWGARAPTRSWPPLCRARCCGGFRTTRPPLRWLRCASMRWPRPPRARSLTRWQPACRRRWTRYVGGVLGVFRAVRWGAGSLYVFIWSMVPPAPKLCMLASILPCIFHCTHKGSSYLPSLPPCPQVHQGDTKKATRKQAREVAKEALKQLSGPFCAAHPDYADRVALLVLGALPAAPAGRKLVPAALKAAMRTGHPLLQGAWRV